MAVLTIEAMGYFQNQNGFKFGGRSGSSSSDVDGDGIDPTDTESGDDTIQKGVRAGGRESESDGLFCNSVTNRSISEKSESLDLLSESCAAEKPS